MRSSTSSISPGSGVDVSGAIDEGGTTPPEGPYQGYGPTDADPADRVEEDLAGWWQDLKDWMKSWFEKTKPAQDIAIGIADQAIPGGEFKDAADIALEGAKTGIKLKALRDLQRSQSEEAGGIGARNGNDTDARWRDYHDVTGKESLRQLDP